MGGDRRLPRAVRRDAVRPADRTGTGEARRTRHRPDARTVDDGSADARAHRGRTAGGQRAGRLGEVAQEQAAAVVEAVLAYDPSLPVLGLPGSAWLRQAEAAGLRTVREAFADRNYTPEGTLVPRREPDAVLHDPEEIAP